MPLLPGSRDREYYALFRRSAGVAREAAELLRSQLRDWPPDEQTGQRIVELEQEGDRLTQEAVQRLNAGARPPVDREDVHSLATQLDDVIDDVEEVADLLALYAIEAPMDQALQLADVLVASCRALESALEALPQGAGVDTHLVEIHRLENEGDRLWRAGVAELFSHGIDPMVVIRWKDLFAVLERAIDRTETVAHTVEGILIKRG